MPGSTVKAGDEIGLVLAQREGRSLGIRGVIGERVDRRTARRAAWAAYAAKVVGAPERSARRKEEEEARRAAEYAAQQAGGVLGRA